MFPLLLPMLGTAVASAAPIAAGLGTAAKVIGGGMMLASALRGPGRAPNFGGGAPPGFGGGGGSGESLAPRPPALPESQLPAHYIVPKDDWRAIPGTNRNGFFDSFIPTQDGYGANMSGANQQSSVPRKRTAADVMARDVYLPELLRRRRLKKSLMPFTSRHEVDHGY